MDLSKKVSFDLLGLLKLTLILVSLGAMLTLYQPAIAWIVIMASVFLAVYEFSSMYYAYKKKASEKKKE